MKAKEPSVRIMTVRSHSLNHIFLVCLFLHRVVVRRGERQ